MSERPPKRDQTYGVGKEPTDRPIIPLPKETLEDQDAMLAAQKERQSWIDEAYEDFVKNGGLEHLPGFGKPLTVPTGDAWSSLLKQAKVEHPWVMLRKEIGSLMEKAINRMAKSSFDPEIDALIEDANKQIAELNRQAPSLSLHRSRISRDNLHEQYDRWYADK
ncbi:DUF1992 domain-containing protein [Paenibacillus elgii]|nr:DUF1992 domain-containing protein [Paenibacillus elgii]NEN85820.1 DUF1992 domain-containing protein [Paenibacillus elgii]PUA40577.1 DUF1992 domain-containing protein [Paenibacillus elgii]